jgi:Ca-activated chloride channel homolog
MNSEHAYSLKTTQGTPLPLGASHLHGILRGELFELVIEQHFYNHTKRNVEIVYTFPLAAESTLLSLEVELDGKTLEAVAVAKRKAERQYEEAISDGDSAILLERSAEGLCTINLGNVMAGEAVVLRVRTLEPLLWRQGALRIVIPTTIAPRYGQPDATMQAHQIPESDALIEHRYTLKMDVMGRLSTGEIASPSHSVHASPLDDGRRFELFDAFLDRDFILNLSGTPVSSAYQAEFEGKHYFWLTALPQIKGELTHQPIHLDLVLDCSGSMGGDSIQQVREGALQLVQRLTPGDHINITRFGGHHEHLFTRLQLATSHRCSMAQRWLKKLDADMGGTNTATAVNAVLEMPRGPRSDLLLVTDGEFWGATDLVSVCRQRGVRLFIIGVGSSPNHADLAHLAEHTGGVYEAVSPNEDIAKAIVHTLHRVRQDATARIALNWPKDIQWHQALTGQVYRDDMINICAMGAEAMTSRLDLTLTEGTSEPEVDPILVQTWPGDAKTLARLVVAARLRKNAYEVKPLTAAKAGTLAEQFNLLSEHTHLLVIHAREHKADALPELIKAKNMLAAGWGGAGSVRSVIGASASYCFDSPAFMYQSPFVDYDVPLSFNDIDTSHKPARSVTSTLKRLFGSSSDSAPPKSPPPIPLASATEVIAALMHLAKTSMYTAGHPDIATVQGFFDRLPDEVRQFLVDTIGVNQIAVILVTLCQTLLDSPLADRLERADVRVINALLKRHAGVQAHPQREVLIRWFAGWGAS